MKSEKFNDEIELVIKASNEAYAGQAAPEAPETRGYSLFHLFDLSFTHAEWISLATLPILAVNGLKVSN